MSRLNYWEDIIQKKRKWTIFRDYIKELWSWYPIVFYKNNGKISTYSQEKELNIVSTKEFFDRLDNNTDYWIEYSFDIWFFDNFEKLYKSIPLPAVISIWAENCDFADAVLFSKNIYLSFIVINWCENVLYSFNIKDNCKNIFNSVMVWDSCENVYMSSWIIKWFNVFYSKYINDSNNIWFSSNLIWCSECVLCTWLINKKYCIENVEYWKDEYFKRKNQILSEKGNYMKNYTSMSEMWKNISSENVKWEYIINSNNVENWFKVYNVNWWRNLVLVWWIDWNDNMYDVITAWSPWWHNFYWTVWAWWCEKVYCSYWVNNWWSNIYYSYHLDNCSFCIWCVGLRNKSYCILNKQCQKDEWFEIAEKIFEQMNNDWILWNFFPWTINPYYFNDTLAYLIDNSFWKEEVKENHYMWRENEIRVDIPDWADIVLTNELQSYEKGNSEWDWFIDESIINKVIKDKKWNVYKVVNMEYEFLVKYWLPLPEIHWIDRIKLWFI